jgi:arylsulfatase A-like enzyme
MVLDACWESLLDAVSTVADHDWLIMLIGARGFPLGEHARIGGVDPRMYSEQLHVPWLVRFPGNLGGLARSAMLTSHCDVPPTLCDWLDHDRTLERLTSRGTSIVPLASADSIAWRDAVLSVSTTARSLRTPNWCLREDLSPDLSPAELYVRPDDRWEANDVARLCPGVVEELRARIANLAPACC